MPFILPCLYMGADGRADDDDDDMSALEITYDPSEMDLDPFLLNTFKESRGVLFYYYYRWVK